MGTARLRNDIGNQESHPILGFLGKHRPWLEGLSVEDLTMTILLHSADLQLDKQWD